MSKNLVIVESPAKAKTIKKFLGKDFLVESSFGHIRDLVKENHGVDIEGGFIPKYEVSKDKKDIVKKLKKMAKEAELVWLASDEDREGEAISWHLKEVLDLEDVKIRRIVFHEITKTAILHAIDNPRLIDDKLVDAQQARRVLDRLVGFELSPVLWRRVRPKLSAGRVQSVSVRLIVDREREIMAFNPTPKFKVTAEFNVDGAILKADLNKKFDTEEEAKTFLESCFGSQYTILSMEKKESKRNPAPPFTTSTMQQEASRKLRFPVGITMRVAQKLYEAGHITYMRTDSVNLSNTALSSAASEIKSKYGEEYSQTRKFKTKSAGAQEAHEAIRPTFFDKREIEGSADETKLYNLIWSRATASQMASALIERTNVKISISDVEEHFAAMGEVLVFDGFLKLYQESKDDENGEQASGSKLLPPLSVDQILNHQISRATQRFSRPAARYTEASLVKKMEELGIGRPSTYAPTISTIQKREYVERGFRDGKTREFIELTLKQSEISREQLQETYGSEKGKLFPTDVGMLVSDYLLERFPKIMDYKFTADVEKEFDEIASGMRVWQKMLEEFYGPFHKSIEAAMDAKERVTGERILGEHPKSGFQVSVRMARFGPVAQLTDLSDEEAKPKYASLLKGQHLESISLEETLELFKLPKVVGSFEDEEITVAIGRFGPYVKHKNKFVSIPKDEDPMTVELERAIVLIKEKREIEKNRTIKEFSSEGRDDVQVLNGRYGPYIVVAKQNVKIPKGTEPTGLSLSDCLELAENAPKKKPRRSKK